MGAVFDVKANVVVNIDVVANDDAKSAKIIEGVIIITIKITIYFNLFQF